MKSLDHVSGSTRRGFLKAGAGGAAAAATAGGLMHFAELAQAGPQTINLYINAGNVTMIDDTQAWMVTYSDTATGVKPFGHVYIARPGDQLTLVIKNNDNKAHNWAIKDIANARTPVIQPGTTVTYSFTVPANTQGTF